MHLHLSAIRTYALALMLPVCLMSQAVGQECPVASKDGPSIPSQVRTLEGLLVYHDGIRQWFELKLDEPICANGSIQIERFDRKYPPLATLRGCRVKSSGAIDFSPTGYYSLNLFQNLTNIEPAGICSLKMPFRDYSGSMPKIGILAYTVEMYVNYRPGDHAVIFHVSSMGKELRPWQAYASYWLTGGFVLYGRCGEGFAIDKVFGTAQANPSHFLDAGTEGDMAAFDPEGAAQAGKLDLQLGYTCIRKS
jgi:hypothetical protein